MPRAAANALLAAVSLIPVAGWCAESPDLERGRALYENHCVACHTTKVHRRVPSLPIGVDDLQFIVVVWAGQQDLRWSREEIDDVVYYLDRVHYRFEK